MKENKKSKKKMIIWIIIVIVIASVVGLAIMLYGKDSETLLQPTPKKDEDKEAVEFLYKSSSVLNYVYIVAGDMLGAADYVMDLSAVEIDQATEYTDEDNNLLGYKFVLKEGKNERIIYYDKNNDDEINSEFLEDCLDDYDSNRSSCWNEKSASYLYEDTEDGLERKEDYKEKEYNKNSKKIKKFNKLYKDNYSEEEIEKNYKTFDKIIGLDTEKYDRKYIDLTEEVSKELQRLNIPFTVSNDYMESNWFPYSKDYTFEDGTKLQIVEDYLRKSISYDKDNDRYYEPCSNDNFCEMRLRRGFHAKKIDGLKYKYAYLIINDDLSGMASQAYEIAMNIK